MPISNLERHFARRMLPLAVAAGAVIALVPPLVYRVAAWRQVGEQARIYAHHLALGVRTTAERQPYLWQYNTTKIMQATAIHLRQADVASVAIRDSTGRLVFGSQGSATEVKTPAGPVGWAPVHVGSRMVASVLVTMAPGPQRAFLAVLSLVSGAAGILLGLLLFLFPTRVVRGQARLLERTFNRLEAAEARMKEANLDLSRGITEAVAEVRHLSGRVVRIQEEERRRIARDLHDGVGQAVTALQIELRLAESRPRDTPRHAAEASRLAEEILAETRSAVQALRPARLAESNIEDALRGCVEEFERRTRVPASFRVEGELRGAGEDTAICLVRILQEALTNITRHARAREVGVRLRYDRGALWLEVSDDGVGFEPEGIEEGTGLRSMKERTRFLRGSMEIDSVPGEGTRICVSLPWEEGDEA